ncbi:hypothetical protein ACFQ51_04405 [Streptomyces kaempferi]
MVSDRWAVEITVPDSSTFGRQQASSGCARSVRPVASTACRPDSVLPSASRTSTRCRSRSACTATTVLPSRTPSAPRASWSVRPSVVKAVASRSMATGCSARATSVSAEDRPRGTKGPLRSRCLKKREPIEVVVMP